MSMRYQASILTASYFPLKVPNAPTSVTATAGNTTASVAFTAPTDVGGGAITSYKVTSSPGGFTNTGATSPITVSGLTNGTAYTFTVTATNAFGISAASSASSAVTPALPPVYAEDVFSIDLYTGNGSTQTITNGIDLSTNGGMVWQKLRSGGNAGVLNHCISDSARGATKSFSPNTDGSSGDYGSARVTSFNSNGYSFGSNQNINESGTLGVSYTFRKQPKFFDIVTYTGNGLTSQAVSHSLGSAPGMIIAKRLDSTSGWAVWHRGNGTTTYGLGALNSTSALAANFNPASNPLPTSTEFYPYIVWDTGNPANAPVGATYVAYLFAHNAGGFGASGNDSIISCGRYTGNGGGAGVFNKIDLGWEPQWVWIKNVTSGLNWVLGDTMRGMPSSTNFFKLHTNVTDAEDEVGVDTWLGAYPRGFQTSATGSYVNAPSDTYIYVAIRRPMRTPTLGTQVYQSVTRTGSGSATAVLTTGITTDLLIQQARAGDGYGNRITSRPQGNKNMITYRSESESGAYSSNSNPGSWDVQNGVRIKNENNGWDQGGATFVNHAFKRAAGFMDVSIYVGSNDFTTPTGYAAQSVTHNLTVVPEFMIVKNRSGTGNWFCYHSSMGNTSDIFLDLSDARRTGVVSWNQFTPTTTTFQINAAAGLNTTGNTYVAYLFATCAGVSKVGSYTGNGSSQTINCGFTTGARFILIKRTDSTGNWYLWDSTRGIVSGNDPYTSPNTLGAEVTSNDSVDPDNSGFIVNQVGSVTDININTATYIFLAIA